MYQQMQTDLLDRGRFQEGLINQTKDKVESYQKEIYTRESEIADLKQRIKNREMEANVAKISDTFSKQEADSLKAELEAKNKRIVDLEVKLFETQKQLDEVVLSRKSEGTAQL